jgi:hypothetical protein
MDTMEIVYYTCRNSECPKHRNVFVEGDPQHENCARERLYLEGQERPAQWLWYAVPAAIMLAAAAVFAWRRVAEARRFRPPMLREERPHQTWSGHHAHLDEREGFTVPPPIK